MKLVVSHINQTMREDNTTIILDNFSFQKNIKIKKNS